MIEQSIPDFLDRFAILNVKRQHTSEVEEEFRAAYITYESIKTDEIHTALEQLIEIHSEIWSYEADLRAGQLQTYNTEPLLNLGFGEILQLAAVGLAAIKIRNTNRLRKRVLHKLVDLTGSGFKDIKVNCASSEESEDSGALHLSSVTN